MVKKREQEMKQEDVEMQDSSDSSSEEEEQLQREVEYSDSSSDEEQEQPPQIEEASDSSSEEEEQQPLEVDADGSSSDEEQHQLQQFEEASDSSSEEEEQQPMEVGGDDSSSDEEQQQQIEEASDSCSEEEQEHPMKVEASDSSSDEEEQQQQIEEESGSSSDEEEQQPIEEEEQKPMEVDESDSSSEEEQAEEMKAEEREAESDSSSDEEQEMEVDVSEAEEQEVESEEENEEEEEVEEHEDVAESETEDEGGETGDKSEAEEELEEVQEQSSGSESEEQQEASSSESEEEQPKAETKKRKPVKVLMPMEAVEPKKKKVKATHEPDQGEDGSFSLLAALRSLPREKIHEMLVIAAKQHADVLAQLKAAAGSDLTHRKVFAGSDLTHRKVFVGGLSQTTSSKSLRKALAAFGEVEDAFVLKDKFSGRSRGFGFATFVEGEAARLAVEKEALEIDGSIVECKHTSDQSPSSSADDKGQKGAVQVDTDRAQRTVFVGGLLKTTSSIGLRKALSAFGGIEDAFIVKDKVSGRSRGFGFATFVKVEAAQRAVETMTFDVDGKTVQCKSTSDYDPDQKLSTADKGEGKQPVADPTQRKVFVGGLTSTTTAISLKKVFSAVGEVEHASVRRDKLTNKPRGFGFVTFVEVEAAQRAAEKRVFKIDGKMVECKSMGAHESDQEPQASVDEWKRKGAVQSDVDLTQRRVFLGGLSQDTSAKGLKKALRAFGKVEGATVHLNKVTGKSRGFGFVTFVQVEAAQLAVEKEMHEIDGNMVECNWDRESDQNESTKGEPDERKIRVRFDTGLENPQASLQSRFQEFGFVQRVVVLRNLEDGKARGIAFILFKRKTSVERALKKSTKTMPDGTVVTCRPWNPANGKSEADPDEDERKVKWKLSSGLENPETPLYHLFKEFGDVELVVAHRDQDGKGRTGSVMFVEKTGAANALKQPVKKLDDGRDVKCKPFTQPLATTADEDRQIIVQFGLGLKHFNATLRSIFAMHGIIERVDVPRDDVTHMVKGIAFVTFREKLAVESALKEPVRMLGKKMEIKCFPNNESGMAAAQRAVEESALEGTKAPEWPEELNEPLTPEEEESTIFVQFPVDATLKNVKKTLQKTFMRLGTVVKVVAPYDPVRRKSRGIASITFVSWVGAKKSVQAPLIKMGEHAVKCFPSKKLAQEAWGAAS